MICGKYKIRGWWVSKIGGGDYGNMMVVATLMEEMCWVHEGSGCVPTDAV